MVDTNNTFTCKIMNRDGFDLLPVSQLVVKVKQLSLSGSTVTISRDGDLLGRKVSADSPMRLMSLGGRCGDIFTVHVEGGDEEAGTEILKEFFINTFEAIVL